MRKKISDEDLTREINSGKSISKIAKKYSMSVASVAERVRRLNLKSKYGSGREGLDVKEWKKLTKTSKYGGRLVSLPSFYIKKLGFNHKKELLGRWLLRNGKLILEIKEAK